MRRSSGLIDHVDWLMVGLFFILVLAGWLNIYAAVYNEDFQSIFDTSQRYGKQLLWIFTAVGLATPTINIFPDKPSRYNTKIKAPYTNAEPVSF